MKRTRATPWRTMGLVGLVTLLPALAIVSMLQSKRSSRESNDCPTCAELARSKAQYKAGQITHLEYVNRKLAAMDEDWWRLRLPWLRERESLLAGEVKAGNGVLGDVLETQLEIARARHALKEMDAVAYAQAREAVVSAYRQWLQEQVAARILTEDEKARRLDRLIQK